MPIRDGEAVFRASSFRTAKIRKKHEKTKAQDKKMQADVKVFFAALREKLALRFGYVAENDYLCSAKQ